MDEYKLNFKLSKELFDYYKDILEVNKCYNNTFNIASNSVLKDFKVVYRFIYREDTNMFNRHCFILHNNRVVDPTAMFWDNINNLYSIYSYYLISSFAVEEYLDILNKNRADIGLYKALLDEEVEIHNQLIDNGYERNYGELGEFLYRVYNKDLLTGIKEYKSNKGIIRRIY